MEETPMDFQEFGKGAMEEGPMHFQEFGEGALEEGRMHFHEFGEGAVEEGSMHFHARGNCWGRPPHPKQNVKANNNMNMFYLFYETSTRKSSPPYQSQQPGGQYAHTQDVQDAGRTRPPSGHQDKCPRCYHTVRLQ